MINYNRLSYALKMDLTNFFTKFFYFSFSNGATQNNRKKLSNDKK